MLSETEVEERLKTLHGAPIDKEMGGLVQIAKARELMRVLEVSAPYTEGTRQLEHGTLMRRCVDMSGVFPELESYQ